MTLIDADTGERVESLTTEVEIGTIVVTDRHRQGMGDIDGLAASIRKLGLLNPITCREVEGRLHLVAGERRLRACQTLGWSSVPVHVVSNLSDASAHLLAERDENTCRKNMTPIEMKALTDRLLEIERPEAKERQRQAGRDNGRGIASDRPDRSYSPTGKVATAAAAKAAGWSRAQYERVKRVERSATDESLPESVREVAADCVAQLSADTMTPTGAETAVKDAKVDAGVGSTAEKIDKAKRDAPPEPTGSGKSRAEIEQKIATYKRMADEGYSSRQIATSIGIKAENMSEFRKRHGLDAPPADEVIGRTRHHDANRILSEMVYGMEAYASSIDLIDVASIDVDQIDQWASSLKESIRSISRFMKELSHVQQ